MSDADALLAAILAHPDEDAPRLMYADAIEEDAPERAEFIRVQVELWRRGCRVEDHELFSPEELPIINELKRRERELWESRARDWLSRSWHVPSEPNRFERGFLAEIAVGADQWLTRADAILTQHPLRKVTLLTTPTMEEMRQRWPDRVIPGLLWLEIWRREWPRIEFTLSDHGFRNLGEFLHAVHGAT